MVLLPTLRAHLLGIAMAGCVREAAAVGGGGGGCGGERVGAGAASGGGARSGRARPVRPRPDLQRHRPVVLLLLVLPATRQTHIRCPEHDNQH